MEKKSCGPQVQFQFIYLGRKGKRRELSMGNLFSRLDTLKIKELLLLSYRHKLGGGFCRPSVLFGATDRGGKHQVGKMVNTPFDLDKEVKGDFGALEKDDYQENKVIKSRNFVDVFEGKKISIKTN
ncbi:hypothetical protein NPIL_573561 [Nephila pilipes]|uniref:Uncharacterized protein n=1 Tax=Nephila pilipes TaxID=299642 RepID=A0A8X6U7V7_NEPPI|nr:hypothetical protein NPIL_573561 [Nephila pilipes]